MDKVLLVTGASSEVAGLLINKIYKKYSHIYLHYSHMNSGLEALIEKIKNEVEIFELKADFSNYEEVKQLIEIVKNRGIIPNNIVHLSSPRVYNKQFHKDIWENCDRGIEISVRSVFEILKAFLPYMSKEKYGRIVFMLTSNTVEKPAKYQASYVIAKYALLGMMKALSVEYMDKGITVNGVSPDMMETKFLSAIPEMIIEQNAVLSPIGRNIKIEEVVPIIEYMLSDAGAAMTGQNIAISGGL